MQTQQAFPPSPTNLPQEQGVAELWFPPFCIHRGIRETSIFFICFPTLFTLLFCPACDLTVSPFILLLLFTVFHHGDGQIIDSRLFT